MEQPEVCECLNGKCACETTSKKCECSSTCPCKSLPGKPAEDAVKQK